MLTHTFRLKPGLDLFDEIQHFVEGRHVEAGCVLSVVGSLTRARIRFANRDIHTDLAGPFEIVSLAGTLSIHGSHLHISISDGDGTTLGGHLLPGCTVYTTAEIVLAAFEDITYHRELLKDDSSYEELVIRPR